MSTIGSAKTSDWMGRINLVVSAGALGTLPAIGSSHSTDMLRDRLVFPRVPLSPEVAAKRYRQLKDAIVAAGIPLLSDDEFREEMGSRRGHGGL